MNQSKNRVIQREKVHSNARNVLYSLQHYKRDIRQEKQVEKNIHNEKKDLSYIIKTLRHRHCFTFLTCPFGLFWA